MDLTRRSVVRSRSVNVAALFAGSIPGFAVSFLIVASLPADTADLFSIGITATLAVTAIVASTYESSIVAVSALAIAEGREPGLADLRAWSTRGLLQGLSGGVWLFPFIVAGFVLLTGIGASGSASAIQIAPLILVPPLASMAAASSGYLTAAGRLPVVFGCLVLRGGPTMVALFVTTDIVLLASTYAAGEALRAWTLRFVARRHIRRNVTRSRDATPLVPSLREWVHQAVSMAVSQAVPITNRVFLGLAFVGAVAIGDASDKIFFAGSQILMSAVLLPAVASFPREMLADGALGTRSLVARSSAKIVCAASVLAVATIGILVIFLKLGPELGSDIRQTCQWAVLLLFGLPFWALNVWTARLLVLAKMTQLLPIAAGLTLAVNIGLNLVLSAHLGATGVMIASVCTYVFVGTLCFWFAMQFAPRSLDMLRVS